MFGVRRESPSIPSIADVADAADRRRFPRVALPVFFRAPRLRQVREPVVDVGQGGLRVFSDDPLEVGTTLELELFLPDGAEIRGFARVAWVGRLPEGAAAAYDIGFELFDMDPRDRERLRLMVHGDGGASGRPAMPTL